MAIKGVAFAFKLLNKTMGIWGLLLTALAFVVDDIIVSFKGGDSLLDWVGIFNSIREATQPVIDTFMNIYQVVLPAFKQAWSDLGIILAQVDIFKGFGGILQGSFKLALDVVIAQVKMVALVIDGLFKSISAVCQLLQGDFQGAWNTFKSIGKDAINIIAGDKDSLRKGVASTNGSNINNTNNTNNKQIVINQTNIIQTTETQKSVTANMDSILGVAGAN